MIKIRQWANEKEGVFLTSYLKKMGIPNSSLQHYAKQGKIQSLGHGAWYFGKGKLTAYQGIQALQEQTNFPLHVGGITSLILDGNTHYCYFNKSRIKLFTPSSVSLPLWFSLYHWDFKIRHEKTSFLPDGLGFETYEEENFSIIKSTKERALFETLYQTPDQSNTYECYQNLENWWGIEVNIELIQKLLENCNSIKVKRLFLCFIEDIGFDWVPQLNLKNIYLGKGYCQVETERCIYEPKYKVSIPLELYQTEMNPEMDIIW
ncbi:MAG: type IV toxin-antitoxin system AbiEi family antitoxin domain-containing protein [Flavobacteriaceae bacterium]|nr:type IV toxin-antitoxin system AbiEi family antitoxin domain-containing protein [Flavobacteriaceae bacterium]